MSLSLGWAEGEESRTVPRTARMLLLHAYLISYCHVAVIVHTLLPRADYIRYYYDVCQHPDMINYSRSQYGHAFGH